MLNLGRNTHIVAFCFSYILLHTGCTSNIGIDVNDIYDFYDNTEVNQNDQAAYDDFSVQIDDISLLLCDKISGIIYFGRDTCSFCLAFNTILQNAYTNAKDVVIYKFDTDFWREDADYQKILEKYDIKSVPALIRINQDKSYESFVPDEEANDAEIQESLQSFLLGK